MTEAEDAVQDAYARWYALPRSRQQELLSPGAWLTTVTSRICLDLLGSARSRRERYVGVAQWAATEERRTRQRLRTQVATLLRLVNTTAGELAFDAADTVDIPPARHRRGALWHA